MNEEAGVLYATNGSSNGSSSAPSLPLAGTVMAAMAELDRQIERGSFFNQAVFQRGFARIERAETLITRLVEILAAQGMVDPEELGLVAAEAEEWPGGDTSVDGAIAAQAPSDDNDGSRLPPAEPGQAGITWPSVALRVDDDEAPTSPGAVVDCDARMHICRAVCCRLKFPLSCAEVDSGKVKWDIGHPYVIRHESSGYCTHNDTATGGCRIYADRPGVCRRYTCVKDTRIWLDFDNMVLNQAWIDENLGSRDLRVSAVMPSMEESTP